MSSTPRRFCRAFVPVGVVCAISIFSASSQVSGDDTAKLRTSTGRRPVQLWPPPEDRPRETPKEPSLELGGWTYRISKAVPRDGVPWELTVTPSKEIAAIWHTGQTGQKRPAVAMVARERRKPDEATTNPDSLPMIEMPSVVWKKWMGSDLQDVVGIHFHEMVSDDTARILYTLHKVPADGPDGKPLPGTPGVSGTRIEATLLAPVTYCLDQTIVVREDPLKKELVARRGEHEAGHADVSQLVFLAVLGGPQDWDPRYCKGRRSRIAYYWKREQIGRSWKDYRKGIGQLLTLRTTIALAPPTRWSMLVPIPPERVTAKMLQEFNDSIVNIGPTFVATDQAAQEKYHAEHGAYELAAGP